MKKSEAIRIANILMDNFKMPVARKGMFDSRVVTTPEGTELLFIGAGARGVYVDIETLEVVKKISRNVFSVEEEPTRERPHIRLVDNYPDDTSIGKTYEPGDYED